MIILAATDPRTFSRLGPFASLGAGIFAVAAASDSAQQGFASTALDLLGYDEQTKKKAGAEAFRKSRVGRKGRKGRKGRGG